MRMTAGRSTGLPADWSGKRKAALVVFALIMAYLHSLYILGFYVAEDAYWWPFWTGMTGGQRLLSLALALFANLGLLAMPWVGRLRRPLCSLVGTSLASAALLSIGWLASSVSNLMLTDGLPGLEIDPTIEILTITGKTALYVVFVFSVFISTRCLLLLYKHQRS